jgi:hypothetical protein
MAYLANLYVWLAQSINFGSGKWGESDGWFTGDLRMGYGRSIAGNIKVTYKWHLGERRQIEGYT